MSIEDARHALDMGATYPYEVVDEHVSPPVDWAHAAARGVLADLCDRRGIKNELETVDCDVRLDITEALSAIIRLAGETRVAQDGKWHRDTQHRDDFAIAALPQAIAYEMSSEGAYQHFCASSAASIAHNAYMVADAMLTERAK